MTSQAKLTAAKNAVQAMAAEMRNCGPGVLHELVATRAQLLDWVDDLEDIRAELSAPPADPQQWDASRLTITPLIITEGTVGEAKVKIKKDGTMVWLDEELETSEKMKVALLYLCEHVCAELSREATDKAGGEKVLVSRKALLYTADTIAPGMTAEECTEMADALREFASTAHASSVRAEDAIRQLAQYDALCQKYGSTHPMAYSQYQWAVNACFEAIREMSQAMPLPKGPENE